MIHPRRLDQLDRHGAQRLVQAERHVPGLRGEDREDRGALDREQASGKQRDEAGDGDRQKAEDGDRLQDVEHRHQHALGGTVLRGQHGEDAAEDQRGAQRHEHAQRRAQQVVRQVPGVERQRQRLADLVGPRHLRRAVAHQHQRGQHQRQQRPVPAVGAGLDGLPGEEFLVVLLHGMRGQTRPR